MAQLQQERPLVAREVLWTYRGVAEDSTEKDFYCSLDKAAAAEIARRFIGGERIWVGREVRLQLGAYTLHARLTNIEPILATVADNTTEFLAAYREQAKDEGQDVSNFIAEIIRYPDERLASMYQALVGIDTIKADVQRKLNLLLRPAYIDSWMTHLFGGNQPQMLTQILRDRYPLIILEGEVGSGKTALARSVGSQIAANLKTEIALFIINAQVRGGGHVGELTQNISRTFNEAERCQEREQIPVMIFIDEADALAQSRGGQQTHHEDDAGVNTLIQRIDRLRGRPMAVIFATNLAQSLDSAIMRRAIATYHFDRPSSIQRAEVFRRVLTQSVSTLDIPKLVALTEPKEIPGFGSSTHRYTYSDLSQRIIPQAVEEAIYAQQPLTMDHLINAARLVTPTPEQVLQSQ